MPLSAGTRLGPYEIQSAIGAGGMGEVYRAKDTKLNRDVALKVLPEAFTLDPDRLARFKREAHMLASLNHPNIGAIYGFEESDAQQALVLELVEGPTLADRIAQGSLPLDEALPLAKQLADALDAAHEQGIIHRDLKPANIKLRADGTVKVLDFGLAKALAPSAAGAVASGHTQSPTITTPAMTQAGVILGTAAYMSPEQAKGREADKRSDVWAFGAVLFEMLSGQRAFDGEDMTDVLGAVVRLEPNWAALPAGVPQALRTLIQRCLIKDRRQRVSEIAVAKFILIELGSLGATQDAAALSAIGAAPRSRWRGGLPLAAATALGAIIVGAGTYVLRPVPSPPVVTRFSFTLPEGQAFSGTSRPIVTISPDGTRLAYSANSRIFLRSIGELEPHEIPGTATEAQGLANPMFAPDGESIAFIEIAAPSPTLKRIPIGGGTAATMTTLQPTFDDATWGPAGILITARGGGILRVPSNGGVPERIVSVETNERVTRPQMLPGGRAVFFTVNTDTGERDRTDKAQIVVQSLADGNRRTLIDGGSDAWYLPSGHLLYAVGGTMLAVPFDAGSLAVTGPAVPVIVGVRRTGMVTHMAVSETGTLIYVPGPATTNATMFSLVVGDGRGNPVSLKIPSAAYVHPRVSPDGRVLAVGRNDGRDSNIWTYNLSGNTEIRRLTFGGNNRFPVWSSDSRRVTFQSGREGDRGIFWQPAGGGSAERLTKPAEGEEHVPEAWSRDGRRLLFSVAKDSTFSLWVLTLDGMRKEPFGRVQSRTPLSASFSPDGRWVAYAFGDEGSGRTSSPDRGVYVEPFPPTGERHQAPRMFTDFHPAWSPDGTSIFYIPTASRPLVSVPITTRPAVAFGTPVELSRGPRPDLRAPEMRGYDVLPDGRFISLSPVFDEGPSAASTGGIRVVVNWFEELKRLVPTK